MAFALDLPADGAAVAQRKQLRLLPLAKETTKERNERVTQTKSCNPQRVHSLTLFLGFRVKMMFGRRDSGPREQ